VPLPFLVGTIHLPALPGSARGGAAPALTQIIDRARADALAFGEGGFDAVIVENFGDVPFAKDRVEAHVVAAMTLVVAAVRETVDLPVGVNVLRNDVMSAVAIAAMAGGRFVRANVYVGAMLTDHGVIEGRAEEVQRLIKQLGADVEVWADVDVKHAAPLAPRPIAELAEDAVERGLASAVIVTGPATGRPASLVDLEAIRAALPSVRLYAGSGTTVESLPGICRVANRAIIGTATKVDGIVTNPVDLIRVRELRDVADGS
jgi:membrane complex biogenesis BtpA family protein